MDMFCNVTDKREDENLSSGCGENSKSLAMKGKGKGQPLHKLWLPLSVDNKKIDIFVLAVYLLQFNSV